MTKTAPLTPKGLHNFSPDLITHLSVLTPTLLSNYTWSLCPGFRRIYLQTFMLPVVLIKSLWCQPASIFTQVASLQAGSQDAEKREEEREGGFKGSIKHCYFF